MAAKMETTCTSLHDSKIRENAAKMYRRLTEGIATLQRSNRDDIKKEIILTSSEPIKILCLTRVRVGETDSVVGCSEASHYRRRYTRITREETWKSRWIGF
jgi:hypothetical protein